MKSIEVKALFNDYEAKMKATKDSQEGIIGLFFFIAIFLCVTVILTTQEYLVPGIAVALITFGVFIFTYSIKPNNNTNQRRLFIRENLVRISGAYRLISIVEFSENISDLELLMKISEYKSLNTPEECAAFMADEKTFLTLYKHRHSINRFLDSYKEKEVAQLVQDIYKYPKDKEVTIRK